MGERRGVPWRDWEMRVNIAAGRRNQALTRRCFAALADAAAGTLYRWVRP